MSEWLRQFDHEDHFDQSKSTQEKRFAERLADKDWVSRVADWYCHNLQLANSLGLSSTDFGHHGGSILGQGLELPGHMRGDMLSADLGEKIGDIVSRAINLDPRLLFSVPNVPNLEGYLGVDDYLRSLVGGWPGAKSDAQMLSEYRSAYGEKLNSFASRLGLPDLSLDDQSTLASALSHQSERFTDCLYHFHLLQQSTQMLCQILPDLASEISLVSQNVLLVKSPLSDQDDQIDFSYMNLQPFHVICLQYDQSGSHFDIHHAYRIVAAAHELSHAFLAYYFDLAPHLPGILVRARNKQLRPTEEARAKQVRPANLQRVISEAIGLWLEDEVGLAIKAASHNSTTLVRLDKIRRLRKDYLRQCASLDSSLVRRAAGYDPNDLSNVGPIVYSEGDKLVQVWKKRGYQISELRQILNSIMQITKPVIGDDMTALETVPVSEVPDSIYQQFFNRL